MSLHICSTVPEDPVCHDALHEAYAKGAQWQRGLVLLLGMGRDGMQPDAGTPGPGPSDHMSHGDSLRRA